MRQALLGGLIVASVAFAGAHAQQGPVFRSSVTMVPVDVTVLDGDGKPVKGLTQDDFEIKLDGKVQPVRTVQYEQAPPLEKGGETTPVAAPAVRTASNATPTPDPRVFVLLVDDLVISPARDKGLFFSASHFVDSLPKGDLVGFTTSTGGVSVNPTHDRRAVAAGLRRVSGSFTDPRTLPPGDLAISLGEAEEIGAGVEAVLRSVVQRDCAASLMSRSQASCSDDVEHKARDMAGLVQDTTDRQVLSYLGVINAMRDLPGQKVLVVMTDGLLVSQHGKNQASRLQPIAQAAAAAGVQFNVLFGSPDEAGVTVQSSSNAEANRADGQQMMQGIQTVADLTGGNFFRVMGQPDRFFGFVADAASGVYHLGVEAPSGTPASHNFTLAAHVKQPGATAHASRVAILAPPAAPLPPDQQLQNAVVKAEARYGVPVAVSLSNRLGQSPGAVEVDMNIEIPGTVKGPLTMQFGLVNSAGKMLGGKKALPANADGSNYSVALPLPIPEGKYQFRLAVADADGHVGSVIAPIDAKLASVGPFTTSDVVVLWSSDTQKPRPLSLSEMPSTATTLQGFLELYPGAGHSVPADLKVRWTLVGPSGPKDVGAAAPPTAASDRVTSAIQVPVASLPPGEYELDASVEIGGHSAGTVTSTFRKLDKDGLLPTEGWEWAAPRAASAPKHR